LNKEADRTFSHSLPYGSAIYLQEMVERWKRNRSKCYCI